jgi:DNA-binding MarR family transcriptional regulator
MGSFTPQRIRGLPTWLLSRASKQGHQLLSEHLAPEGLRRQHYLVLAGVAELGSPTQGHLVQVLRIDGSDMVLLLDDLQDAGYLIREPSPHDRRRNIVSLTVAGREALRRLDRLVEQANEALVARLSPQEREKLIHLLTRMIDLPPATIEHGGD